jgi:diacylglycerol O-acyltransferase / wax synthase
MPDHGIMDDPAAEAGRKRNRRWMMTQPMANVDNFWLCMDDPTNLMMISGFMAFSAPVAMDRLIATLEARLLTFDRFRQRVVRPISGVGTPVWETDPHFDLRSHLHRVALPEPGDRETLQEMIGDLVATPLDESKPLWQVHLIENVRGDLPSGQTGCAICFRLHHCIADGIALIHVLLSMADLSPDAPPPEPRPREDRSGRGFLPALRLGRAAGAVRSTIRTTMTAGRIFRRELAGAVSNPFHLIELARLGTGLATDAATVLFRLATLPSHPRNRFRGRLGVPKRVAWTDSLPLDDVKAVGRALGATINDVLIATVTGALRDYLAARNEKVNTLDLVVTVPVNVRRPGTEVELGNRFSLVFLSLPVHIEDPVLRLREVKRRMDNLKHSPDAFVGFQILNALGISPSSIARRAAQMFANKTTAVMTNVPGPRQALYFAGQKIDQMMFWVPRTGRVGLGISIFSYDGRVTVGLATDAGLVPDPERILSSFTAGFDHLLGMVQAGRIDEAPLVLHDRYAEAQSEEALEAPPAEESERVQCEGITRSGRQCKRVATAGSRYCNLHQPDPPEDASPK